MQKAWVVLFVATVMFAQDGSRESAQLIINRSQEFANAQVHSVEFTGDATVRALVTGGSQTAVWQIGEDENAVTFQANLLAHTAAHLAGQTLVAASPLQLEVYDIERQVETKAIHVDGIDGWPLAFIRTGLCAWLHGNSVLVMNVSGGSESRSFDLGNDTAISMDISPDGKVLAVAVNRPMIRLWSLASGTEQTALPLESTGDGTLLGASPSLEGIVPRSFVIPSPGMATAVIFSKDGTELAAGNETAIHIWEMPGNRRVSALRGYTGRISALAFGSDSRTLVSTAKDRILRVWNGGSRESIAVGRLERLPHALALRADGMFIAAGFSGGTIELWNVKARLMPARITFADSAWIAATPAGLFDASEDAWRLASWQIGGITPRTLPVEALYLGFYRAGLVEDVLKQKMLPAVDLSTLRTGIPQVSLAAAGGTAAQMQLVPEAGFRPVPERMKFHIEAKPSAPEKSVFNIGLALNGRVVKRWEGEQRSANGSVQEDFELELPPGPLRVSAYAFNSENVRSTEAVWERTTSGYMVPQRTLHVLAIGIRRYANPNFNLTFADTDATAVARALSHSDEVRQQAVPAAVRVRTLLNEQATREGILSAIRDLSRTAKPNDAVIIYYAGHGASDQYSYYILPSDMPLKGKPDDLKTSALREAAAQLITDSDLSEALRSLNVEQAALILDSCFSGQALEGAAMHGPLNAQSLSGLAYEKGISLLSASQKSDPSYELKTLGSSVLSYALVKEGIESRKADLRPKDGRIELKEWLAYAAGRVSSLAREKSSATNGRAEDISQQARLALSHTDPVSLVLSVADRRP